AFTGTAGSVTTSQVVTVTAALETGSTATTVTVAPGAPTLVSIGVSPATASIGPGATQQFTATGIYSDGSTDDLTTSVTWSSSDPGVATISNLAGSQGLATGVGAGSTTIAAGAGSVS